MCAFQQSVTTYRYRISTGIIRSIRSSMLAAAYSVPVLVLPENDKMSNNT